MAKIHIFKRNHGLIDLENNLCLNKPLNYFSSEEFDFISDTKHNYGPFSDFEIICKEDGGEKSFRCHRLILSLGSEYFKTMLSGNFCESQGKVEVPDISSGTMAKLLQYIYTGGIDLNIIDIELLSTAHKYQIVGLHAVSELQLAKYLTVETAPKLSVAADLYGSNEFKKYVFRFIAKYWKQFNLNDRY